MIVMDATFGIQDQPAHADVLSPSAASFAPIARQQTVLLTTLRRDGTPVKTPVNIAVDGDRAFIRTWDTAGKAKRIRNNPAVTIAPCTVRGRPTGPAIPAQARILSGDESARAGRLLAAKHPILHGLLVPLGHRLRGNTTIHIELTRSQL
jgi:PPOX class probable F420-dependent enzyme